jgi:LysM repeat protein
VDQAGPVWERPRRREAYPTIKTRMALGGLTLPPLMLGVVAVALAAVALFFLPTLIGFVTAPRESTGPTTGPGSSAAVTSPTPGVPTAVPEPTQQIYLVQSGDTMSKIANRFGIPLQTLIDANKTTVPNPDRLDIGQEVIIPTTTPTALPGVEGSPSPSP